jgi:hypothetical protein
VIGVVMRLVYVLVMQRKRSFLLVHVFGVFRSRRFTSVDPN